MKKALSVVLAAVMAFGCVVCGANNNSQETIGNANAIKIGSIDPLTGGAVIYSDAVNNGAQL